MGRELNELFAVIDFLYQEDKSPFPSADCKRAARLAQIRYGDLKPDLDLYFSEITGYCSWGTKIRKWTAEKRAKVTAKLKLSFFDRHPRYSRLASVISKQEAPALFREIELHEDMRMALLELLDQLNGN